MLENDFNLICRWRVIPIQAQRPHDGIAHRSLMISIRICTQIVPYQRTNLDHFFKQLCLRVITL